MSILSAVKKVVAKVNEHIEDLKNVDTDINELFDRVSALEGNGEKKEEISPDGADSSSEEEGLKLEE